MYLAKYNFISNCIFFYRVYLRYNLVLPTLASLEEFEEIVEEFDPDITEGEIEALFIESDTDGDGFIDLNDLDRPTEAVLAETPAPTPPPVSSSKSSKSNPCAMIMGKKAKKKCLKKAKAPWNN